MKIKMHAELAKVQSIWKQVKILKEEDRGEYNGFMIPFPNESTTAKAERKEPFVKGFINPSNMLLRAKGDAIFKKGVIRNKASESQEAFIKGADKSGQSLQEMVQNEVTPSLAAYGTIFAVMDKPAEAVQNKEEELTIGRPFLTILDPLQVIAFKYAKDGKLQWFAYWVDAPVDDSDPWNPITPSGWASEKKGVAFWTQTDFRIRSSTGKKDIHPITPHAFGFVPVVIQAQYVEPNNTVGASTFFSSSDYLVMGNTLNCASNMEVLKNANSTLAVQVQDWDDELAPKFEKSAESNLKIVNKQAHDFKNVFLFQDKAPAYITRELNLIELAAARAKSYFDLAVENEKRELSSEPLQAPQSGVSKGYDFSEANGMLASLAAALQRFEVQAVTMAGLMMDDAAEDLTITYPKDFDVRSFNQRLEFVKGLIAAAFPSPLGLKEAYKTLTPEITSDEEMQKLINAEIDKDQPKPAPVDKQPPAPGQKEGTNGNT